MATLLTKHDTQNRPACGWARGHRPCVRGYVRFSVCGKSRVDWMVCVGSVCMWCVRWDLGKEHRQVQGVSVKRACHVVNDSE